MKAAVYREYGPPEVVRVEDVAVPVPGDKEVLVRVHATTVCAADWRLRKADPFLIRFMIGLTKPKKVRVLGMEFAGNVESVGKGVTRLRAGDEVFGATGFRFGCHAEYICVPEDGTVAIKPANLTLEESSAILFGGFTALHFLKKVKLQPGQRLLVYGASGSVGTYAVQLAKHFGAHVTAVSSGRNLEMMRSLGADEVVDYTREDFSAAGRIYDAVFDTVGFSGFERTLKVLRRGGFYVRAGGSGRFPDILRATFQQMWASMTGAARVLGGVAGASPADQIFLRDLIEAGKVRVAIDRRYLLDEIVEAHRYVEGGHKRGHVVVVMGKDGPTGAETALSGSRAGFQL